MSRISTKFIADNAITNAKLSTLPANTVKGNITGSTGIPTDVPISSLTGSISVMVGDTGSGGTKGLAPAPAAGDTAALKYLSANGTWAMAALAGAEVSSTTSATTTSLTDVLMTGMTITPIAGTYKVTFSSMFTSSANNATITVSIYSGGTLIGHTVRAVQPQFSTSGINNANIALSVTTQAMTTVSGSQAIEIRWKTTAGTATVAARAMDVFRMWT